MKRLRVFLVLVVVVACVGALTTCNQILYYLSQVYKVYGTVTVAGTDPPTPLGSVEIFVGDYQYSELSNYYGDYEIEMAEGTWTLNFRKEGYEPLSQVVTLDPENRRVELDAALVWIPPPEPIDVSGYWDWAFELGDDPPLEGGPVLLCIYQEGTTLLGNMGFSGSIIDSTFTFDSDEVGCELLGTVSGLGEEMVIGGTVTSWLGDGTFEMSRSEADFGELSLDGQVAGIVIDEFTTDKAWGTIDELKIRYLHTFRFTMNSIDGDMRFETSSMPADWTTFTVTEDREPWYPEDITVFLWYDGEEYQASGGQVVFEQYNETGMTGSFTLDFPDEYPGCYLQGRFDGLVFDASGVATYVDGTWQGVPASGMCLNPPSWREIWETSEFQIYHRDHDSDVQLWFSVSGVLLPGTYVMPDQAWMSMRWLHEGEPGLDDVNLNPVGTLYLETCDESGLRGNFSFTSVDPDANLTGSFDVGLYEEWEPEEDME